MARGATALAAGETENASLLSASSATKTREDDPRCSITMTKGPGEVDARVARGPADGSVGTYGHPVPGIGHKIAFDGGRPGWDPETTLWKPDRDEERRVLAWLAERMPIVEPRVALTQRHPWTLTPTATSWSTAAGR